jgi:hypothetical protein
MRRARVAVLCSLTAAAFASSCAVATALRGEPGGTASPQAGGSQFGVPAAARPVVTLLRVPATAAPGRPPRVTVRVDERGVGTVRMRVLLVDLGTHRTAVTANMGWVHTARSLNVAWPSSARLTAGSYQVTISAHDHHNGNLLRSAHSSGEAALVVQAPVLVPAPPLQAGVPTPAQTAADGAVFPVRAAHSYGGPENRFGAPRAGHIHQGQDILTTEGTVDAAPLAGTIVTAGYQAGAAGYYVVEHTGIGFDFMFAHCEAGSFAVVANQAVAAGQALCRAGQTGDATAPHLHFEMWVGGWQAAGGQPIDPLPYLQAWEHDDAGA